MTKEDQSWVVKSQK